MYIELDSEDLALEVLDALRYNAGEEGRTVEFLTDDFDLHYVPGQGRDVVALQTDGEGLHNPLGRWLDMRLASLGVRAWLSEFSFGPTYAGSDPKELRDILVDARYAEGKAEYVSGFGVNYLGRVNLDPRTIVLVDYKGDPMLRPENDELIHNLITSLPEDGYTSKPESSWTSFGIASSSNVEKLRHFLDYYDQTNILAYSEGAKAKLRFLGRDFAEVETPRPDVKYGQSLRSESSLMRPWAN